MLDLTIPAGFTVKVHEDVADTGHPVLPPSPALSEADLEMVAGGDRDYIVYNLGRVYNLGSGWGNRMMS